VDEKGYVFEALTSPRGTLLVTTGNRDIIPLLSTAPITVLHLPLRMDFERKKKKKNAESYDMCLPRDYTYCGYVLSYEVQKLITSAEHVRIYMEVTRFELERQNTSVKVAGRPRNNASATPHTSAFRPFPSTDLTKILNDTVKITPQYCQ